MVFLVALVLVLVVVVYVSYPLGIKNQFFEQAYVQGELERIGETIEQELIILRNEHTSHTEGVPSE